MLIILTSYSCFDYFLALPSLLHFTILSNYLHLFFFFLIKVSNTQVLKFKQSSKVSDVVLMFKQSFKVSDVYLFKVKLFTILYYLHCACTCIMYMHMHVYGDTCMNVYIVQVHVYASTCTCKNTEESKACSFPTQTD